MLYYQDMESSATKKAGSNMVGENVRRLRLERGLTQEELAQRVGVYQSAIGQVERGETNPLVSTLIQIARALDVEPADLLRSPEASSETVQ